jgi:hypothetical protein
MTVVAVGYVPSTQTAITAETVVATLPFIGQGAGTGIQHVIRGIINCSIGATSTAITVRVRSGATTAGTLIGVADATTIPASAAASIPFMAVDTAVFPAGNQYCVTLACANAVTPLDATIELEILSPSL